MAENKTIKWQVNSLKGEQDLQEINIINVEIHGVLEKAETLIHVKPADKICFFISGGSVSLKQLLQLESISTNT